MNSAILRRVGAAFLVASPLALFNACCGDFVNVAVPPRDGTSIQAATPPADTINLSGKSVAELQELVASSIASADEMAGLLRSGVNYQLRLREHNRHVATAIAAADAIAAHEKASPGEKQSAQIRKLRLLYTSAQQDRGTFQSQLADAVKDLKNNQPGSDPAVLGEALLVDLQHVSSDTSPDEALAAVVDFAVRHPGQGAAAQLFWQLGQRLEGEDNETAALACYRQAIELLPGLPHVTVIAQRLGEIEDAQRARTAIEKRKQADVAAIRSRLGAPTGYFVIYAHEVVPPNGIFVTYRFEYEVLRGADAAVAYIRGLKNNWTWEVAAHFPDTSTGFEMATALAEERIKKETFMKTWAP